MNIQHIEIADTANVNGIVQGKIIVSADTPYATLSFNQGLAILRALTDDDRGMELFRECAWRGARIERLGRVLETGIDTESPSGPFFAQWSGVEKATEFPVGEWPRLLIGLPHDAIERSFKEVRAPYDEAELEDLRNRYPTELVAQDSRWFSQFPENDTRTATGYEVAWGYWIPEPPVKPRVVLELHIQAPE